MRCGSAGGDVLYRRGTGARRRCGARRRSDPAGGAGNYQLMAAGAGWCGVVRGAGEAAGGGWRAARGVCAQRRRAGLNIFMLDAQHHAEKTLITCRRSVQYHCDCVIINYQGIARPATLEAAWHRIAPQAHLWTAQLRWFTRAQARKYGMPR